MKFLIHHTVPKIPKWFSPKLEKKFLCALETSEKLISLWKKIKIFSRKYLVIIRYNAEKPKSPKTDPLGS